MQSKIRIVIADDHPLVRDGIRARLELEKDLEIVAEAADGLEALKFCTELQPDIVMLDISMPRCNGFEAAKRIPQAETNCRIIFLSMHDNPEYIREAIRTGAHGYLLKDICAVDMAKAIRMVADGGYYFSDRVSLDVIHKPPQTGPNPYNLTEREMEVLKGIALGKANKAIAEELGIGTRTVESHRHRMREKLGGGNAAQLTHLAMEMGLIGKTLP